MLSTHASVHQDWSKPTRNLDWNKTRRYREQKFVCVLPTQSLLFPLHSFAWRLLLVDKYRFNSFFYDSHTSQTVGFNQAFSYWYHRSIVLDCFPITISNEFTSVCKYLCAAVDVFLSLLGATNTMTMTIFACMGKNEMKLVDSRTGKGYSTA